MAYSRDEIKQITDKVLNMAKADGVEVSFSGGERSATRFANSSITANLIEHDQEISITVRYGLKSASATTHQTDDDTLKRTIDAVQALARRKPENEELMPLVKPPQNYIAVEAALPSAVNFGPAERAHGQGEHRHLREEGVLGAGYIPKFDWVDASANSEGLFTYFHYADASFILTCRTPDQTGSGWAGTTGVKDIKNIDAEMLTNVAADKALRSRKPRAIEPGNYTVILEPRPAARYLSLMLGSLNARNAEEGRSFMSGKERGDDHGSARRCSATTSPCAARSAIRFSGRRRSGRTASPAKTVTWVEKGVVKNLFYDRFWAQRQKKEPTATTPGMSLVMEGGTTSVDEMIKTTKRGLLVSFFWYIRAVDNMTLLNTGMTRDGLFLIENGEIVAPVQNFRWNESPGRSASTTSRRSARRSRCTRARPTTTRAPRWCRRCASKTSR